MCYSLAMEDYFQVKKSILKASASQLKIVEKSMILNLHLIEEINSQDRSIRTLMHIERMKHEIKKVSWVIKNLTRSVGENEFRIKHSKRIENV